LSINLSIPQFAQLTLGKTEKPLHLKDILTAYQQNVLFLKSTMDNLSNAQAYLFVTMLCPADMMNLFGPTAADYASSMAQFRASIQAGYALYWTEWAQLWLSGSQASGSGNSLPAYERLASILKSAGASIFYLSPAASLPSAPTPSGDVLAPGVLQPWAVIGIVGSVGALANLSAQTLPFWPGGANGWSAQDWQTMTAFASGSSGLLLVPAQLMPAIWQAAQGQVNNLPYAQMILLQGS
jgi:hypothetical protein